MMTWWPVDTLSPHRVSYEWGIESEHDDDGMAVVAVMVLHIAEMQQLSHRDGLSLPSPVWFSS